MARSEPNGGTIRSRNRTVPTEWYENLQLAFEFQGNLLSADLSSLVGSFVVPGSYDDPEASISVEATDESIRETLEELSGGQGFSLDILDEIPLEGGNDVDIEDSYQVPDLNRKRVPGGFACETTGTYGTLAPALYEEGSDTPYFTTSNHLYGDGGRKETEHVGEPLSLVNGNEIRRIGSVVRGYPLADVVQVAPVAGYRPTSEIGRTSPGTVIGQYTKEGLADLMARGEKLRKVGAFSNYTSGSIKGVNGVTCYAGAICKRGQLKWGDQEAIVDGDSGSVNFHGDPEHPEEYVLVGGINNARTWWPGMDFTWGTAAHHLLAEYGLHF